MLDNRVIWSPFIQRYRVWMNKDIARGIAQALRLMNFGLRKKRMAYFGATQGHFAGVSFALTAGQGVNRWFFDTETYEINSPLHPIIDRLNTFQPDVLIGYASALKILADKQNQGALRIHPSVIASSGEPLHAGDRSVIEATFNGPLFNLYISTEHMFMGISKPRYQGMYLLEDDLIFELQDDHTCVTNLFNYTMPLIRYRMNDVLIPQPDENRILPFTKVTEIVGRNEYTPIFTNKYGSDDFISPHIINEIMVKHLERFQIQLIDKESFTFKACFDKDLSETHRSTAWKQTRTRLRSILSEKNMDNVSFEIQEVDELSVDNKTGKFRLILSPNG